MVLSSWNGYCESPVGPYDECITAPCRCRSSEQVNRLEPLRPAIVYTTVAICPKASGVLQHYSENTRTGLRSYIHYSTGCHAYRRKLHNVDGTTPSGRVCNGNVPLPGVRLGVVSAACPPRRLCSQQAGAHKRESGDYNDP